MRQKTLFLVAILLMMLVSCRSAYNHQTGQPTSSTLNEGPKISSRSIEQPQQGKYLPDWEWRFHQADIAIISLDYRSMEIKNVYINHQEPCSQTELINNEQELLAKAIAFFDATGIMYGQGQWGPIVNLKNMGEFTVIESPAGDLGGFGVFYTCNSEILYAGSTIWDGKGEQIYSTSAIRSDAIEHSLEYSLEPQQVAVVIGQNVNGFVDEKSGLIASEESGLIAWEHIKDLNILEGFTFARYSVLVYLYPRSIGSFDPNSADWVILVHRDPTE